MRPGLDLDERGYRVSRHLRDDAREGVPTAGEGRRRAFRPPFGEQSCHLRLRDQALPARRAVRRELARPLPSTERLHADANQLGCLADPVPIHGPVTLQRTLVWWEAEPGA